MNYYEHHIGDYAAATGHLSLIEDAVYTRMLRRYYLTESPLPADVQQVMRLVGARLPEECAAVEAVLGEFFNLADDGWHQKRADENIAKYYERIGDTDEKRAHETERKRRYRERRADLFKQLRERGIVPDFDTPTEELVLLLSRGTGRGQDGEGTATHTPNTKHQQDQKQKKGRASAPACPDDVEPQTWADWLALRKAKRAPVTETVLNGARREADKAGMTLTDFLAAWCRRGSQGFEADWLKPADRHGQGPPAAPAGKQVQGLMALEAMKRERMAGSGNPDGPAKAGLPLAGPDAGG